MKAGRERESSRMSSGWKWEWLAIGAGNKRCIDCRLFKTMMNKSQSACYYHHKPMILNYLSDTISLHEKSFVSLLSK